MYTWLSSTSKRAVSTLWSARFLSPLVAVYLTGTPMSALLKWLMVVAHRRNVSLSSVSTDLGSETALLRSRRKAESVEKRRLQTEEVFEALGLEGRRYDVEASCWHGWQNLGATRGQLGTSGTWGEQAGFWFHNSYWKKPRTSGKWLISPLQNSKPNTLLACLVQHTDCPGNEPSWRAWFSEIHGCFV